MRNILFAFALCLAGPAEAQFYAQPISPSPLPPGASIPAITPTTTAYPGCPQEITSFGNVWYIDPVNGFTQANYNAGTGGAPLVTTTGGASGQGTAAHPWNSLQALTGSSNGVASTGYTQILLSTASGGNGSSPIKPGDEVVLMSGSAAQYGEISFGSAISSPSTTIVNVPAITIAAGPGQTPIFAGLFMDEGTGFHFKNIKIQSLATTFFVGSVLVGIQDGNDGVTNSDIILDGMDFSSASVATANGWAPTTFTVTSITDSGGNGTMTLSPSVTLPTGSLVYSSTGGFPGFVQVTTGSTGTSFAVATSSSYSGSASAFSNVLWTTNARQGVLLLSSDHGQGSTALSCVSVINSHLSVLNTANAGALQGFASNMLLMNNEIDHIATAAIQFGGSNVALINNYGHDFVNVEPPDQYYGIQNMQNASYGGGFRQTNVYMAQNKMIESLDAGQATPPALMNGYLSSCGDITNFVAIDNLIAGTANNGFAPGAIHNSLIANNSIMFQGLDVSIAHCGSTGPEGFWPTNVRVTNNLAGFFTTYGNAVLVDHNIATLPSGNAWVYNAFGIGTINGIVFQPTTPSALTALPAVGPNNLMDGFGPSNEYTAVPTSFSPAMSPAPNFAPKFGSPASGTTSFGAGAILVPPLTDYNGNPFLSPQIIGSLPTGSAA